MTAGGYLHCATNVGLVRCSGSNVLTVMTHNVFWKTFYPQLQAQCTPGSNGVNKCVNTTAVTIAQQLPDVLTLQEITEANEWPQLHRALLQYIPHWDDMYALVEGRGGKAGVITVYNKLKFQLEQVLDGDFLSEATTVKSGRPFLGVRFHSRQQSHPDLIVVNVHLPHKPELKPLREDACYQQISRMVEQLTPVDQPSELIVAGDFNMDACQYLHLNHAQMGTQLKRLRTNNDVTLRTYGKRKVMKALDHIFATMPFCEYKVLDAASCAKARSDHLPVFAKLCLSST